MFGQEPGKPIDVLVVEDTKVEGKELAAGTVLRGCDPLLAMELASGGKVRHASEEALAEFKRNQAAAKKAADARDTADAERAAASNATMAAVVAKAVAAALASAGVGAKA